MGPYTIRVLTEGGSWEQLGKDRFPGELPTPPSVSSDPGGFASCSFLINRQDPSVVQQDLAAGGELEVDFAGHRIFEGYIEEGVVNGVDRVVSVQARGLQYALDENPIAGLWAASTMSEWHDLRDVVGVRIYDGSLGLGGGGVVEVSNQQIVIGYPIGVQWPAGSSVGITRDFGPDPRRWPRAVWFKATKRGSPSQVRLKIRAHELAVDYSGLTAGHDWESGLPTSTVGLNDTSVYPVGGRHYLAQFLTARRYVSIYLEHFTGVAYTPTGEDVLALTGLVAFDSLDNMNTQSSGGGAPTTPPQPSSVRASTAIADIYNRTPGLATATVEPEEFADEVNALGPAWWFRGTLNDATDNDPVTLVGGGPTMDQTPGPLTSGEPTVYADFDGADDGVSLALSAVDDLTLFILFRTTDTGAAGTAWPSGGGAIFDAATATAGDNDYGLQINGAGKIVGGVGNPDASNERPVVVNDGRWHTAALRRRRFNRLDFTDHMFEVIVDGDASGEQTHGSTTQAALSALTLYVGRNAAGNAVDLDVAEAVVFTKCISTEDVRWLHKAAIARVPGTVRRTLLRLPECVTTQAQTPRTAIDALDLYHRYRRKVGRDRLPWYYPPPTSPKYALTDDAVERFVDTSTSLAREQYNRALVTGTRPDGEEVSIYRHAADLAGARLERLSSPAFANPGADVDANGWTQEQGNAIARTTTSPYTGAGSYLVDGSGGVGYIRSRTTISGTFKEGYTYVIGGVLQNRGSADYGSSALDFVELLEVVAGVVQQRLALARIDFRDFPLGPSSTQWRPFSLAFTAPNDLTAAFRIAVDSTQIALDALTVSRSQHSRLDRLGRVRTRTIEFGQNIDIPTAMSVADAFLTSKLRTPFAGTVPVTYGDVVAYGASAVVVHPAELVDQVGELLHFPGLFDPDNPGGRGRDGTIAGMSFEGSTEQGNIAVDNQRDNFEALMARGALLRGGG